MPIIVEGETPATGTLQVRYADGGVEGFKVYAGALLSDEVSTVYRLAGTYDATVELRTAHVARLTWTPDQVTP